MSSSTAFMLALGRFAFKDFKDASLANAGLPTQNGETHAEAGDARAAEATFITATNDPAGFNIIDVLAWGSLVRRRARASACACARGEARATAAARALSRRAAGCAAPRPL